MPFYLTAQTSGNVPCSSLNQKHGRAQLSRTERLLYAQKLPLGRERISLASEFRLPESGNYLRGTQLRANVDSRQA